MMSAAPRTFRITDFYGKDVNPQMAASLSVSPTTLREMTEYYRQPQEPLRRPPRRLQVVKPEEPVEAEPTYTIDDLSPEMRRYVIRECRREGMSIDEVKVLSPTKVDFW